MEIWIAPQDESRIRNTRLELESWSYLPPPWGLRGPDVCVLRHDHYIGSSPDGRVWALGFELDARFVDDCDATEGPRRISVVLRDVPAPHERTVSQLLFALHVESLAGPVAPERIDEIVAAHPIYVPRALGAYVPEAPEAWCDVPVEILHDFDFSENTGLTSEIFEWYRRDSVDGVLEQLFEARVHGLLIGYHVVANEPTPCLGWEVDWTLARRGKGEPRERTDVQGRMPWEREPDQRLVSLYQSVPVVGWALLPHYWMEPVVRCCVAGATPEEAVANWHRCAKALRRRKRALVAAGRIVRPERKKAA